MGQSRSTLILLGSLEAGVLEEQVTQIMELSKTSRHLARPHLARDILSGLLLDIHKHPHKVIDSTDPALVKLLRADVLEHIVSLHHTVHRRSGGQHEYVLVVADFAGVLGLKEEIQRPLRGSGSQSLHPFKLSILGNK